MFSTRIIPLLLAQGVVAACGAWLGGAIVAALGAACGAWLWLAWESWHGARVQAWLYAQDWAEPPPKGLSAAWARTASQTRRWLREVYQSREQAQQRVQDVLAALDASPNGLVLVDAQHIVWANHTACAHWGLDMPRDLGQRIGHLLREPAFTQWWQAQDFSSSPLKLSVAGRSDGERITLAVQAHMWGDEAAGRYLLLSRDVTALEHKESMQRQFVANVSHELRTPLTVLVGFIETLQTLPVAADEREHMLALMQQQAARMTQLVEDLLTLSRLEGTPAPGFDERASVADILRGCVQEARALSARIGGTGEPAHQLHCPALLDGAVALGMIAGRKSELVSAVSNLLSNAIRYTPAGGSVTVRWQRQPDGSAELAIQDTGPGIAAEHLPRLTERFYRVDRGRSRDSGGTGLGLAIVKHALQRHDAQLRIHSELGVGTTFVAVFPASRLFAVSAELPVLPYPD